jgi:hypothetical protein
LRPPYILYKAPAWNLLQFYVHEGENLTTEAKEGALFSILFPSFLPKFKGVKIWKICSKRLDNFSN